ncbi:MAG: hypothetical protein HKN91_02320 [Acidimicrobiia bacterium]|nr:hypothetical protein [Acidimicrobiia bacterium]
MRGTGYAVSEIVWWMLASGLLGVAIGWLLHRVFGGGSRAKEIEAKYEQKKVRYAELSQELADLKAKREETKQELQAKAEEIESAEGRVAELEGSLASVRTELDSATSKASALETNLADMTGELESATSRASAMEAKVGGASEASTRVAELESQLAAKSSELADMQASHAGCEVAIEESKGRIAGLESKVGELQAELASGAQPMAAVAAAGSSDLEAFAASEAEDAAPARDADWSSGETSLGTPAAAHRDDLKVINGIGPKLERTLNGFGIQSWEQLAELTDEQVVIVEEALEEFPGRITRDEWLSQAADLVQRFPDRSNRPDRKTYLNESND